MSTSTETKPSLKLEPVQPGIWRMQVPIYAKAEPVNVWLLVDPNDGSIVIFDTGIAPEAQERIAEALKLIGAPTEAVKSIIVSHQHPDHVGGSLAFHEVTGAPILASQSTKEQSFEVWADDGRLDAYMELMREHMTKHGFPQSISDELANEPLLARMGIGLAPENQWQVLSERDVVRAAGRTWRVIFVPGHSDGQIVLHDEDGGLLLSADHLLERISPAVGRFPGHEPNPLKRYLESLNKIAKLPNLELVLPGHGSPFRGAKERAYELIQHHEDRVDRCIEALCSASKPLTAFDVAKSVFPYVFAEDKKIDAVNARFATTEALAHLEYARFAGRIELSQVVEQAATYEVSSL